LPRISKSRTIGGILAAEIMSFVLQNLLFGKPAPAILKRLKNGSTF